MSRHEVKYDRSTEERERSKMYLTDTDLVTEVCLRVCLCVRLGICMFGLRAS